MVDAVEPEQVPDSPPMAPFIAKIVRTPASPITSEMLVAGKKKLTPVENYPPVVNYPPVDNYPAPAFYFKVVFGEASLKDETAFQEVSGMEVEMEMENVREGGENRYTHRLPIGVKQSSLILKRGISANGSALVQWCRAVFEGGLAKQVQTAPLTVYLMNAEGRPVRAWLFADAFPIKWDVEPFNATKNEVAIEKITLSYTYTSRII